MLYWKIKMIMIDSNSYQTMFRDERLEKDLSEHFKHLKFVVFFSGISGNLVNFVAIVYAS